MRWSRWRGWWAWWWIFGSIFVFGLVSLVVWLWTLSAERLSAAGQVAGVVSGFTAVASLVISVVALVVATRQKTLDMADVEHELASRVKAQWAQEAVLRQVLPVPLRVRWSSTGRLVAAGRDVVFDEPVGTKWQELPLEGDVKQIVTAFRGLPHRQLIVLGEPGAGKSVLAMLLALGLIEASEEGQPVPVLLPIASWDPIAEGPTEFVIRRLGEQYEFLAERDVDGRSLAELLVTRERVLLILDGLDELPAQWHCWAVQALDRFAVAGRPLVVTCRSQEYEQAVAGSGVVLASAAVVEIEPVDVEQAIEFLSHPEPARSRWQPVFDHLRQYPHGPLARALSTPLMVVLARTAYRNPGTDPAVLVMLPDRKSVAGLLIDGFVSTVYQTDLSTSRIAVGERRLRTYDPVRAARWLSCLAYHLYQAGTRDLWWWQLSPRLLSSGPSWIRRLVPVLATLSGALIVGVGTGLIAGAWTGFRAAVVTIVVLAVSTCGVFRPLWPGGYPVGLEYRILGLTCRFAVRI